MTLTSNYDFKPNLNINIQKYRNDNNEIYMVATCPDIQGFVTDGKTEDELIKNIVEVVELFKQGNYIEDREYNIILRYKGVIKKD